MDDEVRGGGFYWVVLGQNPPEIAYCQRPVGVPAAAHAGRLIRSAPGGMARGVAESAASVVPSR
jgi:hypothetical protein